MGASACRRPFLLGSCACPVTGQLSNYSLAHCKRSHRATGGCVRRKQSPVRFDDRLMTVLNQPGEDRHDAAVRWRQLVDLVARAGSNSASPVVAEALNAIRIEAPKVEEALRAAAARAVAALPLPLGLLEYFASDSLAVSAPVLAAGTLDQR